MPTLPSRLSVVTLGARDLPKLRLFYSGLGWPEVPGSGDGWVGFLLGGVLLALYPFDDLVAEAAPDLPTPAGFSGVTLACNVDREEQVDAAFAARGGYPSAGASCSCPFRDVGNDPAGPRRLEPIGSFDSRFRPWNGGRAAA